ncbi:hypothetical protein KSP40_PGU010401 [Platanthera guangdongensis]|uniref:Wall-associated receptor kinase galacturonan-binding domain-containing protein n=1 Tax=Platanthera guangdongensis TaxID=2320717 RepID=A0ABR2MRJ6_9ASPA
MFVCNIHDAGALLISPCIFLGSKSIKSTDIFFLLQLMYATTSALEKGDQVDLEFFSRRCPPNHCTGGSTEIRYPFRLESSHPYCGSTGLILSCSGGRVILPLPSLYPTLTLFVVSPLTAPRQLTTAVTEALV